MKTVLLINSPKEIYDGIDDLKISTDLSYPIGLLSIAGAIKDEDNQHTDYLDANLYRLSNQDILDYISTTEPDYIATNITFPNIDIVRQLSQSIKDMYPERPLIVGGASATLIPQQILQTTAFDYLIMGEGEYTMVELLNSLDMDISLTGIDGLVYRSENGNININKPRKKANMNHLPYMDIDLIPDIQKKVSNELYMVTSRGCDSACTFCSTPQIWGKGKKNLRQYSIDRIFREIRHFENHDYKFDTVHFLDDNFTNDWSYVEKFMDRWNDTYRPKGKTWRCVSRIDSINTPARIDSLTDSGLTQISVGIETVTPKILKNINKRLNISQIRHFLDNCKTEPIDIKGFFMIGFPDETEENIMDTFRFMQDNHFDDIGINIVMAYPNTPLYRQIYGKEKITIPKFGSVNIPLTSSGQVAKYLHKYSSTPLESLTEHVSIERLYELKQLGYEMFVESKKSQERA